MKAVNKEKPVYKMATKQTANIKMTMIFLNRKDASQVEYGTVIQFCNQQAISLS